MMRWIRFSQQSLGYAVDVSNMTAGDPFRRLTPGPWGVEATNCTKDGTPVGRESVFALGEGLDLFASTLGGTNNPYVSILEPGTYLVHASVVSGFICPFGLDAEMWLKLTKRLGFYSTNTDIKFQVAGEDTMTPEEPPPFFGPNDGVTAPPEWPWPNGEGFQQFTGPVRDGYFAHATRDVRLPAAAEGYSVTCEQTISGLVVAHESEKVQNYDEGGWGGAEPTYNYGSIEYMEEVDCRPPYTEPATANQVHWTMGDGENLYSPSWPDYLTRWYRDSRRYDAMQLTMVQVATPPGADDGEVSAESTRKRAFRLR